MSYIGKFHYLLAAILDFRKSKFHTPHAHLGHLEVLHAKFYDRATSNFGDLARTDIQTYIQTYIHTDNVIFIYID